MLIEFSKISFRGLSNLKLSRKKNFQGSSQMIRQGVREKAFIKIEKIWKICETFSFWSNTLEQASSTPLSVFIVGFEERSTIAFVYIFTEWFPKKLCDMLSTMDIWQLCLCMSFDNIDLQIIYLTEYAKVLKEPFLQFQVFFILLKR